MGNLCGATASREDLEAIQKLNEKKKDRNINKQLRDFQHTEQNVLKVLLLGTGESGKSTVFKQMQIMYDNGFQDIERDKFKHVIRSNAVEAMQTLVAEVPSFDYGEVIATEFDKLASTFWEEEAGNAARSIEDLDYHAAGFWQSGIAESILLLWMHDTIQAVYRRRSELQLLDSAEYLFQHMERIGKPDYNPTDEDILRARLRTSGIVEQIFTVSPHQQMINFLDVGGQRNERKKWIHCFDQVASVLFVCAISEFDQFLVKEYPDEPLHEANQNRLIESHRVFEQIVNTVCLSETDIILFLNKIDIFDAKMDAVLKENSEYPKTTCILFEDWDVANSEAFDALNPFSDESREALAQSAKQHLEKKFSEVVESQHRQCYCHPTQATDTDLFQRVFDNIKTIILRRNLEKLGLE